MDNKIALELFKLFKLTASGPLGVAAALILGLALVLGFSTHLW
jgi:hypothetical protein